MMAPTRATVFIQLSFIVQKYWLRWHPLALSFVICLGISVIWCLAVKFFYKWLFPPKDALVITPDEDAYALQDRTYTQYMIREVADPKIGTEAIKEKICSGLYQTIIINEISEL